jgi:hypothetical protein
MWHFTTICKLTYYSSEVLQLLEQSNVFKRLKLQLRCALVAPHILYINLNRSSERRLHTEALFDSGPIANNITRISAIDAREFKRRDVAEELSTYATLYQKREKFGDEAQPVMQVRT